MSSNKKYSKQDCIESLQQAAEQFGYSPSRREYDSLDLEPAGSTIGSYFGWNNAKEMAGLKLESGGRNYTDVPEDVSFTQFEWENLSPDKRYRIRRVVEIDKIKIERGCNKCGYDDSSAALDFHHINPEDKELSIGTSLYNGVPIEKLLDEIEKCKVLCSNCHRKLESQKEDYLDF